MSDDHHRKTTNAELRPAQLQVADQVCRDIGEACSALGVAVVRESRTRRIEVLGSWPHVRNRPATAARIAGLLHRERTCHPNPPAGVLEALFGTELTATVVTSPLNLGDTVDHLVVALREPSDDDVHALDAMACLAERCFASSLETASVTNRLARERQLNRELTAAARLSRHVFHKLLEGGDATTVLDQLSELVQKPVILYTPDFIVTAWSTPPGFDCAVPPRIPVDVIKQQWFTDEVRTLSRERPCVVLGPDMSKGLNARHLLGRLTVHDRITGYLGIIAIGQEIHTVEMSLAELAALALSMQQLSEMLQLENEGRDQEDFLSELLRSGNLERLGRRAPLFGVDLARRHVLVRVEYRSADAASASVSGAVRRARLIDELAQELVVGPPIAVGVPGADVLLLRIPRTGTPREGMGRLRSGLETVVERLRDWIDIRRVFVSEPCEELADYPPAHRDLFSFSQLAEDRRWRDGIYLLADLGVLRLLVSNSTAQDSHRFANRMLSRLEAYDAANGAELTATLRTFLDVNGRIHLAAQALGVHDNTIRYRLNRIEGLIERGLETLDDLMEFRVAFQIRELYGTHESDHPTLAPSTETASSRDLRLVHG